MRQGGLVIVLTSILVGVSCFVRQGWIRAKHSCLHVKTETRRSFYKGNVGRNRAPIRGVALQLKNPLKIKRIVRAPTTTRERGTVERRSEAVYKQQDSDGPPSSSYKQAPVKQNQRKKRGERNERERKPRVSLRINNRKSRSSESGLGRRGSLKKRNRYQEKQERLERAIERKKISLPEHALTVGQLSEILDEKPTAIIKYLMTDLGVMAGITQSLDVDTCVSVAKGFGRIVEQSDEEIDEEIIEEDDEGEMVSRAPVVTIMGHVDHGKTSLLDTIRNTQVVSGEAGGITQHIAAYQVTHDDSKITFIDTPGHEAFSDMRSRGANVTDMVVLVIAADDSVKKQTIDSISCARQAKVPLLVAINKCDLPTADPQRVKTDLAAYDVLVEELGGDVLCSEISAKNNINIDDLLSKIMLQAELQDLKANPNAQAQGIVIEARMEKGLGTVATTLIQKGNLCLGDTFVAGTSYGKVRALLSCNDGTRFDQVGPSVPVNIVGFDSVPSAGDLFLQAQDEATARELAEYRTRISREKSSASYQSSLMQSVSNIFTEKQKQRREMCVVVKADVQGSAEALARSLSDLYLENEEAIVNINVLVSEAGDITKTDVAIASVTPGTTILAFNCAANLAAMDDARTLNIPIEYYTVVYDAIESIQSRMQEILSPTPDGQYVGSATVQEVFNIGGLGNIAGSKCLDGIIKKGSNVRVMRGDKILTESKVKSLRNFKQEVDSITAGDECGIGLTNYETFQVGDIIESYVVT